jgi:hypothetical protein
LSDGVDERDRGLVARAGPHRQSDGAPRRQALAGERAYALCRLTM